MQVKSLVAICSQKSRDASMSKTASEDVMAGRWRPCAAGDAATLKHCSDGDATHNRLRQLFQAWALSSRASRNAGVAAARATISIHRQNPRLPLHDRRGRARSARSSSISRHRNAADAAKCVSSRCMPCALVVPSNFYQNLVHQKV